MGNVGTKEGIKEEVEKVGEEGEEGGDYKRRKREYKKLCGRKRKVDNERWGKRAREIRRGGMEAVKQKKKKKKG